VQDSGFNFDGTPPKSLTQLNLRRSSGPISQPKWIK